MRLSCHFWSTSSAPLQFPFHTYSTQWESDREIKYRARLHRVIGFGNGKASNCWCDLLYDLVCFLIWYWLVIKLDEARRVMNSLYSFPFLPHFYLALGRSLNHTKHWKCLDKQFNSRFQSHSASRSQSYQTKLKLYKWMLQFCIYIERERDIFNEPTDNTVHRVYQRQHKVSYIHQVVYTIYACIYPAVRCRHCCCCYCCCWFCAFLCEIFNFFSSSAFLWRTRTFAPSILSLGYIHYIYAERQKETNESIKLLKWKILGKTTSFLEVWMRRTTKMCIRWRFDEERERDKKYWAPFHFKMTLKRHK